MKQPHDRSIKARFRRAGGIVGIALWAGMLTGLIEAAVLWFKQAVLGQVIFASRHLLWMTPLMYMIIFAAVAVVIATVAFAFPRRLTLPVGVFLFTALGAGCLLLPIDSIRRIAELLLAIGLGVQAARWAGRATRVPRAAVGVTVALVAIVAAMGVAGWGMQSARRSVASVATAASAALPNVLIIVLDTVRAANLSLYGYQYPTTPSLTRIAQQSVVFERAVATSPWTLPSHATMFTGRFPHEVSSSWFTKLDGAFPTLAEVFQAHGYATGGFVANHHYTAYDSGLDRGFQEYQDYRLSFIQLIESAALTQAPTMRRLIWSRSVAEAWDAVRAFRWYVPVKRASDPKHADEVNREFLEWERHRQDRPFFAFLNYFDAHRPYWAPPAFQQQLSNAAPPMNRYDAAIAYMDDQVEQLLSALESRGVLANTIVIVTSDHGELFGEHGLVGHAHNLYFPVLHVPLLIRFPESAPGGLRVAEEVSLRDLPATVLDLARFQGVNLFPGQTLARYWDPSRVLGGEFAPLLAEVEKGRNNPPEHPISRGPLQSLVADRFHYIRNGDGQEELYAYEDDPEEAHDLVGSPESEEVLERFRSALDSLLGPTDLASTRKGSGVTPRLSVRNGANVDGAPSMLRLHNTPSDSFP